MNLNVNVNEGEKREVSPRSELHSKTNLTSQKNQADADGKNPVFVSRELLDSYGWSNVSKEMEEVYTDDPASFLIFNLIATADCNSVSELKDYLRCDTDLVAAVDPLLVRLERMGVVRVEGDRVFAKKEKRLFAGNSIYKLLPALFSIASGRVLKDAKNQSLHTVKNNRVFHMTLPNTPDVVEEANQIVLECKARLLRLAAIAQADSKFNSEECRFVGVVSSTLEPEDFV